MFSNVIFYFPKRCNVKKIGSTNQRQKKMGMIMDPRNESLPVPNRRCQNANIIAMYGLSNSFTIKFR